MGSAGVIGQEVATPGWGRGPKPSDPHVLTRWSCEESQRRRKEGPCEGGGRARGEVPPAEDGRWGAGTPGSLQQPGQRHQTDSSRGHQGDQPSNTLISGFWPPEPRENEFPAFNTPDLWSYVVAAPGLTRTPRNLERRHRGRFHPALQAPGIRWLPDVLL